MEENAERDLFGDSGTDVRTLDEFNETICAADPLIAGAGRTVPGEGPEDAAIAFVGEQPGDQEDLQRRPFVGPAGQLFDKALREAGLERGEVYITNAVKNFKFRLRGKRRIHQKPTSGEVRRYRWWLEKELDLVQPKLVVALGSTAAFALTGHAVSIGRNRGKAQFGRLRGYITVHPSFLLRIPDDEERARAYEAFVADLRQIRRLGSREAAR